MPTHVYVYTCIATYYTSQLQYMHVHVLNMLTLNEIVATVLLIFESYIIYCGRKFRTFSFVLGQWGECQSRLASILSAQPVSPRSCAVHLCVGQPGELPIHPGGTERGEGGGRGGGGKRNSEREGTEWEREGQEREGGRKRERGGEGWRRREREWSSYTTLHTNLIITLFLPYIINYLCTPGEASGADDDRAVFAPPALLLEAVRVLTLILFFPRAVESEARRWFSRSLDGPKNALPALVSTTGAVWILQECTCTCMYIFRSTVIPSLVSIRMHTWVLVGHCLATKVWLFEGILWGDCWLAEGCVWS